MVDNQLSVLLCQRTLKCIIRCKLSRWANEVISGCSTNFSRSLRGGLRRRNPRRLDVSVGYINKWKKARYVVSRVEGQLGSIVVLSHESNCCIETRRQVRSRIYWSNAEKEYWPERIYSSSVLKKIEHLSEPNAISSRHHHWDKRNSKLDRQRSWYAA